MSFEHRVKAIVEQNLRRTVVVHDDGSHPGMYDLRVGATDSPEIAIECIGAVDPIRTETWNVGPGKGALSLRVVGDWTIGITHNARIRKIQQHLEPLLREFEQRGISHIRVTDLQWRYEDILVRKLEALGIQYASCFRTSGTGRVYFTMEGVGGAVDETGSAVSQWIGDFLQAPARQDVLIKLARSGAVERHVFIVVDMGGAPWAVESYLTDDLAQMPAGQPNLPSPVTGVWLSSTFGRRGVQYAGTEWKLFTIGAEPR